MQRDRNMTPGRYLKRNFLYILLTLLALALVAGAGLLLWQLIKPEKAPSTETSQSQQQEAEAVLSPEETMMGPQKENEEEQETQTEENAQLPEVFVPPFEGTTKFLANQKLAVTYDEEKLKLSELNTVYSLLNIDGDGKTRLDLQELSGSLSRLSQEEMLQLSIGLLQEYYFAAPPTADITVVEEARSDGVRYTVILSTPAYHEAPALRAKVSLMQAGDQFWFAIALLPEDGDTAAVEQAFDNLVIR